MVSWENNGLGSQATLHHCRGSACEFDMAGRTRAGSVRVLAGKVRWDLAHLISFGHDGLRTWGLAVGYPPPFHNFDQCAVHNIKVIMNKERNDLVTTFLLPDLDRQP